jgi:zinc protease
VIEAGSADDPQGQEGVTRALARMMAEGGTQSLTYEALTQRLFPMAARIRYHIDRDTLVITGEAHRDHATIFYPLLRDVVLAPRFADEDFARIKTQSLADLRLELRGSSDETLGKELLQSLIYRAHPYGHPAVGAERALDALTLDQVRAQYRRVVCPARIMVGLAGGYPAELAETVRHDFDALPAACAARAALPDVTRPHGMHVVIVDKPASSSTAISFGHALTITRTHEDFATLQLATNYLGLHRQSVGVLYQTLREARGLNYGDYAYAEHFEQEVNSRFPRANVLRRQQYASVWLRPVPSRYAHFALRAAVRAVERVARDGVAQADIERVRGFLDGYVGLYTQTESARLGYTLDDALLGVPGDAWAPRMRRAWAALTTDTVRDVTRRHLTASDLWVAIVAPDARALAEAIAANAPSPITYDSPKPPEVVAEDAEIAVYPLAVRAEDVQVVPLADVFR